MMGICDKNVGIVWKRIMEIMLKICSSKLLGICRKETCICQRCEVYVKEIFGYMLKKSDRYGKHFIKRSKCHREMWDICYIEMCVYVQKQ